MTVLHVQQSGEVIGSADSSRDAWVDAKLMHTFMRYAAPSMHTAVLVMLVIVVLLYGAVDGRSLWLWTLATTLVAVLRYAMIFDFRRQLKTGCGPNIQSFARRAFVAWTAGGVVWGASMFVFFLKAPLYDQFVCLTVLLAMPGFAVGTFSANLRSFNGFVDGLCLTVLIALFWELGVGRRFPSTVPATAMVFLALLFWFAMRLAGKRFYVVQRASFELEFDNNALVASLTQQTRSALDAVAAKNRFIASAAHDLRQPIHALSLYASWLVAEPELVAQITPKITRSTRAVNDMFDSLFDFAGLETATLQPNFQDVDLKALILDLELQYAPIALERDVALRTRVFPARVRTDPTLLKRLIGNLISNALKNTRSGGVLMAIRRRQGALRVEIWDSGAGIAREHQQIIFQEFYRIPQTGTEEGFGLGLAIVSGLSRAMGHRIGMASRVGRGSVFWVEFGAVRTPETTQAEKAACRL